MALDLSAWGLSFERIIAVLLIIVLTVIIERLVRSILNRVVDKSTEIMHTRKTSFVLMKYFATAFIYIAGLTSAILMIPPLEKLAISIFAGAGILAVVIGFASQQAFSNIVSGVFIAIFKPFRIGDTIEFQGKAGVIEDITLRHTVVKNFENKRYIVPNSIISNEIIENFHIGDEAVCRFIDVGIGYDSDINRAMKIMKEEAIKHPDYMDHRTDEEKKEGKEPVVVRVMSWGDFSINLRAYVWCPNPGAAFRLKTDLLKTLKERFDKEGIEIPYPYRTIVYKNTSKAKPGKTTKTKKRRRN